MTTTYPSTETAQYAANPLNRWLAKVFPLNWETLLYIVILVLAIFTRFYLLGDRTMSHDESLHTKFSWDLYSNGVFQHTPLMHGPILFHMTALSYFLFGDNDFTARIYPAVLGILMVMFPLLFRRWIGRWGALLASVMFLISPLILFYNRYIREDTPSIFFTLVMVYCTFMYLNGPTHLRRKARWLYIFSAAMLGSMATKEVSFMYLAIFFSILFIYWLARMGEQFFRWHGKTIMYFASLSILIAGVAALGMYVILEVAPLNTAITNGPGSIEFASFFKWTLAVIVAVVTIIVGPLIWVFRRALSRVPWLDVFLLLVLVVMFAAAFIWVEERSRISHQDDASAASAPVVPGEEAAASATSAYRALPFYAEWVAALMMVALIGYSAMAGWWRKLHRFPELDLLIIMGTLALPWATPFVMKLMGASVTSMPSIAAAVQAAIPFIQFDLSNYGIQFFLSFLTVLPAFIVAFAVGLAWDWKRWLICAAVFHILFLFFFTTVFTNFQGIFTGMIGSLGYWLEQQAVRRGNQPQYYYVVLIMPFYEFLPIIGSILAMFTGMGVFWKFRKDRLVRSDAPAADPMGAGLLGDPGAEELPTLDEMLDEPVAADVTPERGRSPDRLRRLPILLFLSWWSVFNLIAYTLAGEKMPWLGTHMTTPMIFLAAWFFGQVIERIDAEKFWQRTWLYLIYIPVLVVALAQVARPLLFGPAPGGLQQEQLTRTFQWFGGILIAALVIFGIYRIVRRTGWSQLRSMVGVGVFVVLAFFTFRSAWMAAFINYDNAKEFLVYAHGGPKNKEVEEMLEELGRRTTGDSMDLKFAYDYRISWPGAWYFRNFKNAVFLGESPSPRQMEDAAVIIVGNENKATVEAALEDQYYRFDYVRMWWPMQDYFNLTPQRINNVLDFSAENVQAGQIREGLFDIWWSRDYQKYGEAVGRDFDLNQWPLADRMFVYVRKDIAAQVWNLGIGEGSVVGALDTTQVNLCTENWEPRPASQVFASVGTGEGQLNFPRQMAVAADGRLYTAEEFNHRISVFNADGTFAFSFGQEGSEPGMFQRPNGVAIGPSGNIYVADTWNYRVQVFNPEGEFITSWGQPGELGSGASAEPFDAFWGPRSIAVDAAEQVYVADTGNKRVRVYNKDGLYLRDIGSGGSGNGQLDEPAGLAISPDGKLYVADTWNRRISVFNLDGLPANIYQSSDGQLVNNFRVRGWADDLGNRPYLAVDPTTNHLFVTDPDAGRVLIYDALGQCVSSFGQLSRETQDNTQFASVGGIAVSGAGDILVGDAGSGRILRFAPFEIPSAAAVNPPPEVVAPQNNFETTPELIAPVGVVSDATEEITVEVAPETTDVPAG
jgi:hypothetical protein